jgi:molybdopterin-guanine dinucleotide biosynthesis protein B
MPEIVTFIGWHDSGKTNLATQVVNTLKNRGYRVGVIKSSKETGISFDSPGTDTDKHRQAGAEPIMFIAPDQQVLMSGNQNLSLGTIAHRFFPDVDIVIGEGFKKAGNIDKIEVVRDKTQNLRGEVEGVIAVATDLDINEDCLFAIDEHEKIASFIEERYLQEKKRGFEKATLLVNGTRISLTEFVQNALSGSVAGFVKALRYTENTREIELRIKLDEE